MLTKQQILDMIHAVEVSTPLEGSHECDGRYSWPKRWETLKTILENAHVNKSYLEE